MDKQKSPLTESVKDEQFTYPRCHLDSHCCALSRIPSYPRQLNVCHHVAEYFARRHLTAPSAVHLPYCFPPGSQPPGLSVGSYNGLISASSVSLVCMIHFFSAHVKGFAPKTSICTSRGAASKQNTAHFTNTPQTAVSPKYTPYHTRNVYTVHILRLLSYVPRLWSSRSRISLFVSKKASAAGEVKASFMMR